MHSKKIVHRDLRPATILISEYEENDIDNIEIKVTDFGYASLLTCIPKNSIIRTVMLPYMAPELI